MKVFWSMPLGDFDRRVVDDSYAQKSTACQQWICADRAKHGHVWRKLVDITEAGREMRVRCVESVSPLIADLSRELSDKDFASALPVLEKVGKYLDSHRS